MNKNGFLLVDSLITVAIVSIMSLLCIQIYKATINYEEGYRKYKEEINELYDELYYNLGECEKCIELEEDSSLQEQ